MLTMNSETCLHLPILCSHTSFQQGEHNCSRICHICSLSLLTLHYTLGISIAMGGRESVLLDHTRDTAAYRDVVRQIKKTS